MSDDMSVLSDATLQQLAAGHTPDPATLTTPELKYLAENPPDISMGESLARGAQNNFPLANQAIAAGSAALGDQSYSQNLAQQNRDIGASKQAHPIAYGTGAVAGAVAPMAIPGVGEALGAEGLGTRVAANAAYGAASGVGSTDVVQHPGEAVKQAAVGAGIGGGVGAILPTGKSVSEGLEKMANAKGVQALNLRPGTLGVSDEEIQTLGKFAHENDLIAGSTQDRVGRATQLLNQTGQKIGEIGGGAQPLADPTPYIDNLQKELESSSRIFGPEANPEATAYRQAIANLSKPGITFDQLQQLKMSVGQRAFDANGQVKNDALANVYGQIKDAMKSIIDSSPEDYQKVMDDYGTLKDIHSGLTNQLQKEQASGVQAKGFGMVGKLAGMIEGSNPVANVATAAALAPSHPFMALGALTPLMGNPAALSGAARTAAAVVPKVAGAAKAGVTDAFTTFINQPSAYGKYAKPLLQATQQGGRQGFAATSFVLRQQNPELNDMMLGKQKAPDEGAQ